MSTGIAELQFDICLSTSCTVCHGSQLQVRQLQNGVQFDEGQLDQRMSSTYGSQGRVAGSLLLFW